MYNQFTKSSLPRRNVAEVIKPEARFSAWAAYAGDFPNPINYSKADKNHNDAIILPLIAQIVDTSVAHLLGEGIKFDVDGDDTAAQTYLDLFLQRSKYHSTIQKAALNGAVVGHCYLKLIVTDGKPNRFQVVQSSSVQVETDPRDTETAISYTISWQMPVGKEVKKYREITRKSDNGQYWVIDEYVCIGNNTDTWRLIGSVDWLFPFAPIWDCQNLTNPLAYTGKPDVTEAIIKQNYSINTVISLTSRLLRNHASPKTIVTGLLQQNDSKKDDRLEFLLDNVISLPDSADMKQLNMDASGANALLDLYVKIREALHTTSRTPEVASGKLESLGAISGTALQILFRPLIEKTNEKRLHMGEMLADMAAKVLFLGGFGELAVKIIWDDTTPSSETEERQNAQSDLDMGVASIKTISGKLGYDYDAEQEQIGVEAEPTPDPSAAPIGFRQS